MLLLNMFVIFNNLYCYINFYTNLISHQFNKVTLLLVAFDVNICISIFMNKNL